MDITNFMSWFINQVANIVGQCLNILQNITFMGTNLLQVILTILIIGTFLPVILTLNRDSERVGGKIINHNDKVKEKNEKEYRKAQGE